MWITEFGSVRFEFQTRTIFGSLFGGMLLTASATSMAAAPQYQAVSVESLLSDRDLYHKEDVVIQGYVESVDVLLLLYESDPVVMNDNFDGSTVEQLPIYLLEQNFGDLAQSIHACSGQYVRVFGQVYVNPFTRLIYVARIDRIEEADAGSSTDDADRSVIPCFDGQAE